MSHIRVSTAMGLMALCAVLGGVLWQSCSKVERDGGTGYGYVQFRLHKAASTVKSTVDELNLLADACKLQIMVQHSGSTISQTLVLNSYNAENAEFGLRSDKLKLIAGDYVIIGYNLYDSLDGLLYTGTINADNSFTVVSGGLVVYKIGVNAVERGKASFKLVKKFIDMTKSGSGSAYPLDKIKAIDLSVTNIGTREVTLLKGMPVTFVEDFYTDGVPSTNAKTSYSTCDTTVWLAGGDYRVTGYTSYADSRGRIPLETAETESETFKVRDNAVTEGVEVPVFLSGTSEAIKDYIALKEIWDALDGEHWSYYGESLAVGCNWDFNKDIDLWGDQPGVTLNDNGRVTTLSLVGFGAKGAVPDAIGQLTELQILSLGTHDEKVGGQLLRNLKANMSEDEKNAVRWDYDTRFLAVDGREGLSQELRDAIDANPQMKPVKSSRIELKADVESGVLSNGITSVSRAVMRLTNLQQFYIANSPITDEGFLKDVDESSEFYAEKDNWSWSNMKNLTDVEIYNCPELTKLPVDMLGSLPELVSLNLSRNTGISAGQLRDDWTAIADAVSGPKIQLLYLGYNNLEELPEYEHLNKMSKLGLLDLQSNRIKTLHPFGKEVHLVKLYLNNNSITSVPKAADGYFFGYNAETESVTFAHNEITEFPDIFNARSNYTISSVDFSYNKISSFENGDAAKGVNAATVDLSYNRLETFPAVLFAKGSPITTLTIPGNGMKSIPKGAMTGPKSHYLSVIDLSYNKLSSLPDDFKPTNIPYLYGIDISYNCFSNFPYNPLNCDRLDVFNIRHQRDEKGNRILKTWPTGLYQCPSLTRFFIGSNDLRKIEDTFTTRLRILELADNPNISVDLSDIAAYIKAGYTMLIRDEEQDIRGL